MNRIYTILLAGGSGERMQAGINKVFLPVGGSPCLARSIEAFNGLTDQMVVVIRPEDRTDLEKLLYNLHVSFPIVIANGGHSRQDSVSCGLKTIHPAEEDLILIHDGARCLVTKKTIRNVISSCREYGSGVAAVPLIDTIKRIGTGRFVMETPLRSDYLAVQTPQGFKAGWILEAEKVAERDHFVATDDAALVEHIGKPVHLCEGSRSNIKLTTREDLMMAEMILQPSSFPSIRVGHGYDVHALTSGRDLILCGVRIPYEFGLLGHSDADVALHALMDAMLGAACLGDIGHHYPDTDDRFKNISSLLLLKDTCELLKSNGFHLTNADITIIAQRPKLSEYIPMMQSNIENCLGVSPGSVNIKATTTERLGFEGRMEGISAHAVCMIESVRQE